MNNHNFCQLWFVSIRCRLHAGVLQHTRYYTGISARSTGVTEWASVNRI